MPKISRRDFLKIGAAGAAGAAVLYAASRTDLFHRIINQASVEFLESKDIDKFVTPLLIPPVMPKAGEATFQGQQIDYYEISMRQFTQQILPPNLPKTTVWGYGPVKSADPKGLLLHNAPSLTIEARANVPTRIKWINELVDSDGNYLPHLLPVDPTLHWANPPQGSDSKYGKGDRDMRPVFNSTPERYTGPVPIVTHVHGAVGVGDESDGYSEAWYLPAAKNLPQGYATEGSWYTQFADKAKANFGEAWGSGFAICQYPNLNRASTVWYHDHALGLTRLNVYTGPAGFYIVRGGADGDEAVLDSRTNTRAVLPGPAPQAGDPFPANKTYYEIPIAIQDRAFNSDGSLFYPDSREQFDEYKGPYIPETDLSPIWNPEFFGNTIMVNGNTWPYHTVEQRRYRFRVLNGCQSRFLFLDFNNIPGVEVWQIGCEGGFLSKPINLTIDHKNQLLMALAERADLIVDFTKVPQGRYILANLGPDDPYGGGQPGDDFEIAKPTSTGQIMEFRVVPAVAADPTTPPQYLQLPAIQPLPSEKTTRTLALMESVSSVFDGPSEAKLGNVDMKTGMAMHKMWGDPVSENPKVGDTEIWEFYNFTSDAHPMHVHEVAFEVVNRQVIAFTEDLGHITNIALAGKPKPPEAWEQGLKDTVIAYPSQVTRIKAKFDTPGQFVWHCHIVEHEDNEMMRPYRIE
jgi:FtsP/CotA-like multicopper oxidase with cupredoxin domain